MSQFGQPSLVPEILNYGFWPDIQISFLKNDLKILLCKTLQD